MNPAVAHRRLPLADEARGVDRKWRPVYAVWELTLRCNLACRHCGSRAGRVREDELTTAAALDVVAQLAALGVPEVTLAGGEAYLREDWTTIARAIRDHGMMCGLVTAGRGLTPELVREARRAGVQSVALSVDGLEETHDWLRGKQGTWAAALATIREARSAGLHVSSNTQIGRKNLREIPELFEHLARAGIQAWQVQLTVAMGRAADEPRYMLEPWQMLELMPMLARCKRRADEAGVVLSAADDIGYFGPYETLLRGNLPRGHGASCGAGRSIIGVEANGDIKGCLSLPTAAYVGGNVREHPLAEIWERGVAMRFTRDRTVDDLWGFCRGCYYADTCRAGCSGTAHVIFGRPGNNPLCHHRALERLARGQRERLVPKTPAPGTPLDHGTFELVVERWPEAQLSRAREVARTGEGWID